MLTGVQQITVRRSIRQRLSKLQVCFPGGVLQILQNSNMPPLGRSAVHLTATPANIKRACAALFARAKDLKQFKGPSLENWENKLWCLNKNEEDKDYIHMRLICIKRHWEESRETNDCSSPGGSRKQGK